MMVMWDYTTVKWVSKPVMLESMRVRWVSMQGWLVNKRVMWGCRPEKLGSRPVRSANRLERLESTQATWVNRMAMLASRMVRWVSSCWIAVYTAHDRDSPVCLASCDQVRSYQLVMVRMIHPTSVRMNLCCMCNQMSPW